MPLMKSRIPFSVERPYRPVRPVSSKIIFLALEGSVTEEEYFARISEIYSEIKTKIQFVSVAEDAVFTVPKYRTPDQQKMLSKVRPKHLVQRMDAFKTQKEDIYQFSEYKDDEFWIVMDVDQNWSDKVIDPIKGKTYQEEWNDAIAECQKRGYGYAVSNPFFEMWLLLHHDDPTKEDCAFAVNEAHPYEKTNHFQIRLKELGAPLKDKKHISFMDYSDENVREAIRRADALHLEKQDLCPAYFATTVYLLLQKIMQMLPM